MTTDSKVSSVSSTTVVLELTTVCWLQLDICWPNVGCNSLNQNVLPVWYTMKCTKLS
jgi:hypothetical protein